MLSWLMLSSLMLSSRNGEHRGASSPVFDLFTALGWVS